MSNTECDYSFEMLYKAAFGRNIKREEKEKLQGLPQKKINVLVMDWVKKAGWIARKRKGSDNKIYTAFYPIRPS